MLLERAVNRVSSVVLLGSHGMGEDWPIHVGERHIFGPACHGEMAHGYHDLISHVPWYILFLWYLWKIRPCIHSISLFVWNYLTMFITNRSQIEREGERGRERERERYIYICTHTYLISYINPNLSYTYIHSYTWLHMCVCFRLESHLSTSAFQADYILEINPLVHTHCITLT